ncbi:MAG: LutB/LldF family L-lactate oxidation iron-sulfur protein [Bacteroidota bacterium]
MSHAKAATQFNQNQARTGWHDQALWFVRQKRDRQAVTVPEWEDLRELGSQIKGHMLSNMDEYLIQFEANAQANGVTVHWAKDATEHNKIVYDILQKHKVQRLVKSKSMLTEECHLNPFLERMGIEVVDTDLGERIVQLKDEPPSHIVMPAIHLKKEEIGDLFHEKLGTEAGASDPQYLTEAARQHLRERFLQADAALTGVNFAIAETGGVVVCTNEGNADMGVHLPKLQIHCMGMEKLIPRLADLGVFLRLLARSATGQPITTYSSHFHKPRSGSEMHIVILDNGRSNQLGRPDFRKSLQCIRCGACMNTCPVYRRSGGHSYGTTVPGPIGSILTPGIDLKKHASLPFASTLCGSCSDVCPVKIDIHTQLYKWRQIIAEEGHLPRSKRWSMQMAAWVFARPKLYRWLGKRARWSLRLFPSSLVYGPWNTWGKSRDLPDAPKQSFRDWMKKNG